MSQDVAVVFTAKSIATLLEEGGSGAWRLDRNRARRCAYVVCTRNAKAAWVQGTESHQSAFLVGKISDVVPAPGSRGRYLVRFREYARINIPNAWKGDRNPVRYATLEDLGIDPADLEWQVAPEVSARTEGLSFHARESETGTGFRGSKDAERSRVSYVRRLGENYALLMSPAIAERAGLAEGARVEIEPVGDGRIMVSRSRRHFTLEELLDGMDPDREPPLEDDAPRGEETL